MADSSMLQKQKLQQEQQLQQKQKLRLSHAQLRAMELTTLTAEELEQAVRSEMEKNAAIGEADAEPWEDVDAAEDDELTEDDAIEPNQEWSETNEYDDDTIPLGTSRNNRTRNDGAEGFDPFSNVQDRDTLQDNLREQVEMMNLSSSERFLVGYIIDLLDDNGFLARNVEGKSYPYDMLTIADEILFQGGEDYPVEEVEAAVKIVQTLDPAGIGARNLQENFLIQLRRMTDSPTRQLAEKIVAESYEDWLRRNVERVMQRYGVSRDELREAEELIGRLNHSPGKDYGSNDALIDGRMPEFTVHDQYGTLKVGFNRPNIPTLKVDEAYVEALKGKMREEERRQTEKQVEEAETFMLALKLRGDSMLKVMKSIVALQHDYFATGNEADLKPMLLKDVAMAAKCDESTVSRVTSNKSVETDFGVVPLKKLFSAATTTAAGEEVSTKEVKAALRALIEEENKRAPLPDQDLQELLEKQGYKLARRTVTKYREELGYSIAKYRKQV